MAKTETKAFAIPIEMDTTLECVIVFTEGFVNQISAQNPYSAEIVLPLFEELLHVRLYSSLWQEQGFLYPTHDSACTADLFKMCMGFHDEYIVNRWKYEIVSTQMTITRGGFTLANFPLISELEQAQITLFALIHEAAAKNLPPYKAWLKLLIYIYRNIFELLARYEAALAALGPQSAQKPLDLYQSQFYQQNVALYWDKIRKELERSYNSNLKETPDALQNILKNIIAFLASIGVNYHTTDQGNCEIDFVIR